MKSQRPYAAPSEQTGVSLIIVMVMLLLGTIVVLGSTRLSWFNERFVGGQSDYQRTYAAAEALLLDAEYDIRGLKRDGTACKSGVGYVGCRSTAQPFFPEQDEDLDTLETAIGSRTTCKQGICFPTNVSTFGTATWTTNLSSMTAGTGTAAVASTYGQHTGAAPQSTGNPILFASPARAWYWVEVFRYANAGGLMNKSGSLPIPDKSRPFVYRITAYAQGLKPGSRVWLREVFVPYPQDQLN